MFEDPVASPSGKLARKRSAPPPRVPSPILKSAKKTANRHGHHEKKKRTTSARFQSGFSDEEVTPPKLRPLPMLAKMSSSLDKRKLYDPDASYLDQDTPDKAFDKGAGGSISQRAVAMKRSGAKPPLKKSKFFSSSRRAPAVEANSHPISPPGSPNSPKRDLKPYMAKGNNNKPKPKLALIKGTRTTKAPPATHIKVKRPTKAPPASPIKVKRQEEGNGQQEEESITTRSSIPTKTKVSYRETSLADKLAAFVSNDGWVKIPLDLSEQVSPTSGSQIGQQKELTLVEPPKKTYGKKKMASNNATEKGDQIDDAPAVNANKNVIEEVAEDEREILRDASPSKFDDLSEEVASDDCVASPALGKKHHISSLAESSRLGTEKRASNSISEDKPATQQSDADKENGPPQVEASTKNICASLAHTIEKAFHNRRLSEETPRTRLPSTPVRVTAPAMAESVPSATRFGANATELPSRGPGQNEMPPPPVRGQRLRALMDVVADVLEEEIGLMANRIGSRLTGIFLRKFE